MLINEIDWKNRRKKEEKGDRFIILIVNKKVLW